MSTASLATRCSTSMLSGRFSVPRCRLKGHEGSVEAVAFAHSLALTLTAGMDGKLCIWENASLEMRGTCEHPEVGRPHVRACRGC
jgi:WD40 repeat protein